MLHNQLYSKFTTATITNYYNNTAISELIDKECESKVFNEDTFNKLNVINRFGSDKK